MTTYTNIVVRFLSLVIPFVGILFVLIGSGAM
jgi:hypothetical protein